MAFTLNYIMGAGFLALPWAFYQVGIVVGITTFIFTFVICVIASSFVLEAISRGQLLSAVLKTSNSNTKYQSLPVCYEQISSINQEIANDSKLFTEDKYIVGSVKMEIPELCHLFLGNIGRQIYTTLLGIYMYCSLWAYASVFAKSFTSHMPIGSDKDSYLLYLTLFGTIVVPATCLELKEQVWFQVALASGRVVMVLLMLGTIIAAVLVSSSDISNRSPFHDDQLSTDRSAPTSSIFSSRWDNIYLLLPSAMYAGIFHHSIPALSEPVHIKKNLGLVYATTLFVCFASYLGMCVAIGGYFGNHTTSSSNLLWVHYRGQGDGKSVPLYAKFM